MSEYVTDTVGLILRLEKRQMGAAARAIFADVEQQKATLYIPSMVLAEILYLSERKRISATLQDVRNYINNNPFCSEQPLTFEIVTTAQIITDISELHDRLIAATAAHLNVPLITNGTNIRDSIHVQVIWETPITPTAPADPDTHSSNPPAD